MDAAGATYTDVADATGLSKSTVYRMTAGDLRGSLYSWHMVADFLGVPVSYFVQDMEVFGGRAGSR